MDIQLYGIRHHGPGSSKSLLKALEEFQPDILLVEAPEELEPLLAHINDEGLEPPVAALIYNPKELQQAIYYPFTNFSPEWQAFRWAESQQIPIWAMDLPQALRLGLDQEPERLKALQGEEKGDALTLEIAKDPLGYLARLAGYTDSERWWEVYFEQGIGDEQVFEVILELMQSLREEIGTIGQADNLIREAYMRKILRKAIKSKYQKIAVVCGAWHTPALANLNAYKVKEDNALLKGIAKIKTKATWIPWTYERIATNSGYGAGVLSPAWYALLFENYEQATIRWMTKVSQLFQQEDLESSAAHAIEGVRLAETLAIMRGLQMPGIEELTEAVQTIFSNGYSSQLDLVRQQLIVGDLMGQVPDTIPIIPLQQDLESHIKVLKLKKYRTTEAVWLKATTNKPQGGLDLRQAHDLKQSQFLHRLLLLNIPWGSLGPALGRELSTKNEYWQLKWRPEFALRIIEAGMWGNTVEQAASTWVQKKATTTEHLQELTSLLEQVIHADLPQAMEVLVKALEHKAAVTKDIQHLMQALPPLVRVQRYGDVRNTASEMIELLLKNMLPRICIGLPMVANNLEEQASAALFEQVLSVNRALLLLNEPSYLLEWQRALAQLVEWDSVAPNLRGIGVRLLLDSQELEVQQAADYLSYALSQSADNDTASRWLQGFLHGSGLLLLHNPDLWALIDAWMGQLNHADFQQLLPALRRTFSNFAPVERQKMLQLAKNGVVKPHTVLHSEWDEKRVATVRPLLQLIFGNH